MLHGNAAYKFAMRGLLTHRRLLFIGHSASDLDLLQLMSEWQEIFQADGGPQRHVFLGADMGPATTALLRSRGLEPIDCESFENLPGILRYLAKAPDAAPAAFAVRRSQSSLANLLLSADEDPGNPARILLVDDEHVLLHVIARALRRVGMSAEVTSDGALSEERAALTLMLSFPTS